ncbi:12932_t:CDS:2, partial [Acaulospora colombiana]
KLDSYRKTSYPKKETFEAGKLSIAQGHRDLGVDIMLQSLALHEQSYGFLHPATAKCYAALAMYFYHNEDLEVAIDFQKKAVVVLERTCGVDSVDSVHSYLHLGLFENAIGNTELALRHMRHAMYYWEFPVPIVDSGTVCCGLELYSVPKRQFKKCDMQCGAYAFGTSCKRLRSICFDARIIIS